MPGNQGIVHPDLPLAEESVLIREQRAVLYSKLVRIAAGVEINRLRLTLEFPEAVFDRQVLKHKVVAVLDKEHAAASALADGRPPCRLG